MNYYMNKYIIAIEDSKNLEVFTAAENRYKKDNFFAYSKSLESFQNLLEVFDFRDNFLKDLEEIKKGQTTLTYVAVDYMIPIVIVKYFLNHLD